jgi:hypothetical protein
MHCSASLIKCLGALWFYDLKGPVRCPFQNTNKVHFQIQDTNMLWFLGGLQMSWWEEFYKTLQQQKIFFQVMRCYTHISQTLSLHHDLEASGKLNFVPGSRVWCALYLSGALRWVAFRVHSLMLIFWCTKVLVLVFQFPSVTGETHCMYLKNSTGVRIEFLTNVLHIKVPRNCQHKFTQLFCTLFVTSSPKLWVHSPYTRSDVTNTASDGWRVRIFQVTVSRVL